MTKKAIILIATILSGINAILADETTKYAVEVGDFTTLQVIDDLNVVYRCSADSAGIAVFDAPMDMVSNIMFSVNKNKLKIEKNIENDVPSSAFPVITVYSNFLQSVENCGDSVVTVESPAPGPIFKARVIGNGKIEATGLHMTQVEANLDTGRGCIVMTGKAKAAKYKNIGTGRIEAAGLQAETGSVLILGTGPVECWFTDEITVKGAGTGKVWLKGNPKIKKRSIGSISVNPIE